MSKKSKNSSVYEMVIFSYLSSLGVKFKTQYKYSTDRAWKADFYIPETHTIIEVNGGIYQGFGHGGGAGLAADYIKYSWASMSGYKLCLLSTDDFRYYKLAPLYFHIENPNYDPKNDLVARPKQWLLKYVSLINEDLVKLALPIDPTLKKSTKTSIK